MVVQYWEKWTGTEADQMKQIVDDFNNSVGKEKHIVVEYLAIQHRSQNADRHQDAGAPPDVAGIWDGQLAPYAAIDALVSVG